MPDDEVARAPVDDLTEEVCAACGSGFELERVEVLHVAGVFIGLVFCQDCLRVHARAWN